MKLLLITLTFMSISFEVFAKDTFWECSDEYTDRLYQIKVEDPFLGKRKMFLRGLGVWNQVCKSPGSIIFDDSFKCTDREINGEVDGYFIFDEISSIVTFYNGEGRQFKVLKCKVN